MKSDSVYLRHILDAIQAITTYTTGVDEKAFRSNTMLQDAVVRQLEIVGEASRRISESLKERYPEVPWRDIVGLRNRIAHEYIDLDLKVIWEVVQSDLPVLSRQIERMLG